MYVPIGYFARLIGNNDLLYIPMQTEFALIKTKEEKKIQHETKIKKKNKNKFFYPDKI